MSEVRERERLARAGRGLVRRRGQGGFTLIEMLVVIAILGILAMVVTLSMFGVVTAAQRRANDGELMTIQAAMDAMMMNQQIAPENACPGGAGPSSDMRTFPVQPPNPNDLSQRPPLGSPAPLYPRYLRKQGMNRAYTCSNGTVTPVGS